MTCARLFEAEAMRDGRLGDVERASYERHVATCRECADEVAALAVLAERLRTQPTPERGELHARRERTRILATFDKGRVEPARSRAWLLAPVAVVLVGGFFAVRTHEPQLPPIAHAEVRAEGEAAWTTTTTDRERIVLAHGTLAIHVTHATPGSPGVVVALPDGELEDTGTTFTVRAEDGRTTEVSVKEGSVVLKLRGRPIVALAAGESWTRTVPPPPTASIAPVASSPPAVSTVVAAPPPPIDSASEYRSAVNALDRGDNAQAASLLAAFVDKHPADAHAEDAAYLRVIALERTGNKDAMRAAAATYVERFPTGFRRAEVDRLAGQ